MSPYRDILRSPDSVPPAHSPAFVSPLAVQKSNTAERPTHSLLHPIRDWLQAAVLATGDPVPGIPTGRLLELLTELAAVESIGEGVLVHQIQTLLDPAWKFNLGTQVFALRARRDELEDLIRDLGGVPGQGSPMAQASQAAWGALERTFREFESSDAELRELSGLSKLHWLATYRCELVHTLTLILPEICQPLAYDRLKAFLSEHSPEVQLVRQAAATWLEELRVNRARSA